MSKVSSALIERCTPSQLKALLALAAGSSGIPQAVPVQVVERGELSRLLAELCQDQPESGELLLTTVCARETPLEALREIKELAKQLLTEAQETAHRNAATFLYHAAIAAAFGFYGIELSSQPITGRRELYRDVADALAGDPLGQVFRQAVERATKK